MIRSVSMRDARYPIGHGHGSDAIHRDPVYPTPSPSYMMTRAALASVSRSRWGWEGHAQAHAEDEPSWPGRGQLARFQIPVGLLRMNFAGEFNDCRFRNSCNEFLFERLPVVQFLAEYFSSTVLLKTVAE
jgi:hypothetical protein